MQPPHKVLLAAFFALLIAGGLTVIFVFFWLGVLLMYAGAVVLAIDLLCHPWNWKLKSVAMLIPVLIIVPTSIWAWGSAPLEIQVARHYGNYKEGDNIGGITWKDQYSELVVTFVNHSSNDYQDFDAFIGTDLGIASTGWIEPNQTCVLRISLPHVTEVRMKGEDEKGNPIEKLGSRVAATGPYHLHCDKLIRRDTVTMVFALVNMTDKPEKPDIAKPESLLGPKKLASWSSVSGTYTSLFRPYSFFEKKQLTGN